MAVQRHPEYGRPANASEWSALGAILGRTFGFPKGRFVPWSRSAGRDNFRVARRGARVAGGLVQYPMGMWFGGPQDPFLALLRDRDFAVEEQDIWMVRVTDLRRALEARGYPPGLEATVDLEVDDDLLPGNRGRWTVQVSGGRGKVRRGGKGTVRLDALTLAPLYTGFRTPHDLRTCGAIEGPEPALATLAAVFAGPAPWIREMF